MKRLIDWIWQHLPSSAAWVWEKLAAYAGALFRSIVALVKSPAVWMASLLVFVLGFSAGHLERAGAIRTLKAERDKLMVSRDTLIIQKESMATSLAVARREAEEAKAALAAFKTAPPAKSPPAVKPAPAKKVGKVTPTSADVRIRNPFGE